MLNKKLKDKIEFIQFLSNNKENQEEIEFFIEKILGYFKDI